MESAGGGTRSGWKGPRRGDQGVLGSDTVPGCSQQGPQLSTQVQPEVGERTRACLPTSEYNEIDG